MTQQIINTGSGPDSYTGDTLRTAFEKTNDNFDELYTLVGNSQSGNLSANSVTVTGNVTAARFIGDGSLLTGITAGTSYANSNVASYLPVYTGNVNAAYYFGNGSQLTGIVATANLGNLTIGGATGQTLTGTVAGSLIAKPYAGNVFLVATEYDSSGVLANLLVSPTASNGVLVRTGVNAAGYFPTLTMTSNGASVLLDGTKNSFTFSASPTVGYAYSFGGGGIYAQEFYANANLPTGYQFTTPQGLSGMSHLYQNDINGNVSVIKISHDNTTPAKFYENNTSLLSGNLIIVQANSAVGSFPNAFVQTYSTANTYTQFVWQNLSNGAQASGDIVITADNGTDETRFVDIGIAGSGWDGTQPNSLGTDLLPGDGYFYVQDGNLALATRDGSTSSVWKYKLDGGTIFPTLSTARGDTGSGTLTGQTLLFGDATQEAIITTPDGNAIDGQNSQRLVINPGKGQDGTGGEGGDIYLWAGRGGSTDGNGGDIKIRGGYGPGNGQGGYIRLEAGDAQGSGSPGYFDIIAGSSGSSEGGYINMDGGTGATDGGYINIDGGYGTAGNGGAVTITGGGSGQGLANYGNVRLQSGASTWSFDNTGNLTLPSDTFAVNYSNGTPVSFGATYIANGTSSVNIPATDGNIVITIGEADYLFDDTGNLVLTNGFKIGAGGGNAKITTTNALNITARDTVNISTNANASIQSSAGIPTSVANWSGGGGWNQGFYGNLVTTGGTGTGLTVNVAAGGGGYISINEITISTPGTGYTDGDVITIDNENNIPGTFTIGVPINTWTFNTAGVLTVPGEGVIQSLNDTVILQSKNTTSGNIYTARLGTSGGLYFETTEYPQGWLNLINNEGNASINAIPGIGGAGGKSIYINAGAADQTDFFTTPGGDVNINGGLGASNDGGGGGKGGNVNITAGNSADTAGHAGNVNITSGSNNWVFDYSGELTAPGNITSTTGNVLVKNIRTIAQEVHLGQGAGLSDQGAAAIAIGRFAATTNQGDLAIAVGYLAGQTNQGDYATSIGYYSAVTGQSANAVAIGTYAGQYTQGTNSVAVGRLAGNSSQGSSSVAVGASAGASAQGVNSVAVGVAAAETTQGNASTALGWGAGQTNQGDLAVALGSGAAYNGQGYAAIAIGADTSPINQGQFSIAIGAGASTGSFQANNSVLIDATGTGSTPAPNAGLYINPVRSNVGPETMYYNSSTKEITYSANTFVSNTYVPSTAGGAGTIGQFSFDGSYVYVCVATNTWKRANLSTW